MNNYDWGPRRGKDRLETLAGKTWGFIDKLPKELNLIALVTVIEANNFGIPLTFKQGKELDYGNSKKNFYEDIVVPKYHFKRRFNLPHFGVPDYLKVACNMFGELFVTGKIEIQYILRDSPEIKEFKNLIKEKHKIIIEDNYFV